MSYQSTVLSDTPVGYYPLNETSGTTVTDHSGNGRNGTLNGTVTLNQSGVVRDSGSAAMLFDGSTGYISLPNTGLPTGNAPWTIDGWYNFSAITNLGLLAGFGTASTSEEASNYVQSGNLFAATYGNDTSVTTTTGVWRHVAATWDGSHITLYVNGVNVSSRTVSAMNIPTTGTAQTIARNPTPSEYFYHGYAQCVAFYATCLTATRILAHYQAGIVVPLSGTLPSASALSATLPLSRALLVTVPTSSALSATTLDVRAPFSSTLAGDSALSAQLRLSRPLSGSLVSASALVGNLQLGNTLYASPGDNLTTIVQGMQPGQTLLLNDGTYTHAGARVLDFTGVHGTTTAPITVAALHDGAVFLDGGGDGSHQVVYFDNCSYITLQGISAANGETPYQITNNAGVSQNITLQRCTGHDAVGRNHIFSIAGGSGGRVNTITLEDCAGWGQARYIFIAYRADTVTFRRCWADWTETTDSTNQGPYATCSTYGATDVTWENFIGQNCYPKAPLLTDTGADYLAAIMTSDSVADTGAQYLGCLWFNCWGGFQQQEASGADANTLLRHCVLLNIEKIGSGTSTSNSGDGIVDSFASPYTNTYDHLTVNHTTDYGLRKNSTASTVVSNSILTNLSGGGAFSSATDVTTSYTDFHGNTSNGVTLASTDSTVDPAFDTTTYGAIGGYLKGPAAATLLGAGSDGQDLGAKILYQYVDGALTTTQLWPWPMDSRIQAEHGITPTTQIWTTLAGLYPAPTALAATLDASGSLAATLAPTTALAAPLPTTGSMAGALTVARLLAAGMGSAAALVPSTTLLRRPLSGSLVSAGAGLGGVLTASPQGALSASLTMGGALAAQLVIPRPLLTTLPVGEGLGAALPLPRALVGQMGTPSTLQGTLATGAGHLTATLPGAPTLQGSLSLTRRLVGSLPPSAALGAALHPLRALGQAPLSISPSPLTGSLSLTRALSASLPRQGSLRGTLSVSLLWGTLTSFAGMQGSQGTITRPLAAAVSAEGEVGAALTLRHALVSTLVAETGVACSAFALLRPLGSTLSTKAQLPSPLLALPRSLGGTLTGAGVVLVGECTRVAALAGLLPSSPSVSAGRRLGVVRLLSPLPVGSSEGAVGVLNLTSTIAPALLALALMDAALGQLLLGDAAPAHLVLTDVEGA